jgi:hypothetical protein
MGLNDLTLEKLISEINGYKEKMRSIYEDYGRASQELQDRINVLGYNLNEHLKTTKDQIGSTPQRLLTLETKYVSGEVNEGEYRTQREEFKHLLERNLQSIEEIKSMITVLSHIEAKPLNTNEFRQTTTPQRTNPSEEWGRGVFSQERPSPSIAPVQPTASQNTSLRFGPETTSIVSETSVPRSSTSLPQPQPSPAWNANPQPASPAPTAASLLPVDSSPNVLSTPVEAASAVPVTTLAPEVPVSAPSLDTGSITADAADVAPPTEDIVNAADDALMVKVVDDVPTLDASAAVVSTDTSQIQPSIPGADTATSMPATSDLTSVSLTPPTQFYKVVCPKCGADVPKPAKVWELKGGKSKKNVLIGLFQCQDCRVKFREALTREII